MSSLKALINPVTPFEQNAPIIYCENTKKCAFVDPGGDNFIQFYFSGGGVNTWPQ